MPSFRRLSLLLVLALSLLFDTVAPHPYQAPRLRLVVTGAPTLYGGANNSDPQRIFYTIAHLWSPPFLLSVDSGSRWPWIYVTGARHCFDLDQAGDTVMCPNVPRLNVSRDGGEQLNGTDISFEYGAGIFTANSSVSSSSGFYARTFNFAAAAAHHELPVSVFVSSFVGVNQVAVNTPVLNTLQSGILGVGPPCFQGNDTDQPCEPFFLGQLQHSLGFADPIFEYELTLSGSFANSPSSLASGALTFGALSTPMHTYAWQPVIKQARMQGLWYVGVEYAISTNDSFAKCNVALVDTGGGPTQLPSASTWHFNRNCTTLDSLPTYWLRLPASGAVLTFTPADYIIRFWNDTINAMQCESSVLFASATEEPTPVDVRSTSSSLFCVIGMWTATKYALAFNWNIHDAAVGFRVGR